MTVLGTAAPEYRDGWEETKAEPAAEVQRRRAEHLRRRVMRVLFDLGLDRHLSGWVAATDDGEMTFAPLPLKVADRLICALEDVVRDRQPPAFRLSSGQRSLFDRSQGR
jgi:hypothetical protein